jgi:hypothetical protein
MCDRGRYGNERLQVPGGNWRLSSLNGPTVIAVIYPIVLRYL